MICAHRIGQWPRDPRNPGKMNDPVMIGNQPVDKRDVQHAADDKRGVHTVQIVAITSGQII